MFITKGLTKRVLNSYKEANDICFDRQSGRLPKSKSVKAPQLSTADVGPLSEPSKSN